MVKALVDQWPAGLSPVTNLDYRSKISSNITGMGVHGT